MKTLIIFTALWAVALSLSDANSCYKDVTDACQDSTHAVLPYLDNCTAQIGAFPKIQPHLQKYIGLHLTRSFEYLLMSTHFANYNKNRPGFEKLFRKLSDDTWEDSIKLIKYIAKRGGRMDFNLIPRVSGEKTNVELYEYYSIAKALDIHKELTSESFKIHKGAAKENDFDHDPELTSYLEEEFMHKHRDIVRDLAGYATDLHRILREPDTSLSLYLFDEYLQKK